MNGYEIRTQRKREDILKAAQELFSERGITDVSVGEIAKKAQVSQVTVFKYFGDKMTLARETAMAYVNQTMTFLEELLEQDIPFAEKLQLTLAQKQNGLYFLGRPFLNTLAWDDPLLQQLVKEALITRVVPVYEKLIRDGVREGAVDGSIPPEAITAYIFAFFEIFAKPDYLRSGNDYIMGLAKLFYYGLIGK